MSEAGLTSEIINIAIREFMLKVISGHSDIGEVLCNKDPLILKRMDFLQ